MTDERSPADAARDAVLRTEIAVLGRRLARFQKEAFEHGADYVPSLPTWGTDRLDPWIRSRDPAARGAQRWVQSLVTALANRADADRATRSARLAAWATESEREARPELEALLALRHRLARPHVLPSDAPLRAGLEATWTPEVGRFTVTRRTLLACLRHESCDEAHIELADPLRPVARCKFAADEPCTLKLMACEALLDLVVPTSPANPVRDYLARPPWQRLVDRLAVVGRTKDLSLRPSEPEARLSWVVAPAEGDIELAWVRPRKRQDGLTADRIGTSLKELEPMLEDPRDRLAFIMARGDRPSAPGARLGPILTALLGHPNLYLRHDGELLPVRVVLADPTIGLSRVDECVGLIARQAGKDIAIAATPRAGEWLVDARPADGEIVVGRWTRAAALAWEAWAKAPEPAPIAARDALGKALLDLVRDVPVSLDAEWLGESLPPAELVVLRLSFSGARGAKVLTIEGLVEPVAALGPLAPGSGSELVPLVQDDLGTTAHVRRDFARERGLVRALAVDIGLDPERTSWRIDQLDQALAIVPALDHRARQGGLRLEWSTRVPTVARGRRGDRMRLQVESRRDWLGLSGSLVVAGGELPLRDLLLALRDKKRFVILADDRFFELDEELRARFQPLLAVARIERQEVVASPLAAPLFTELEGAGIDIDAPSTWLDERKRVDEARDLNVPIPAGLCAELRHYQEDGFRWLARLAHWASGACLADDMGLGKTVMALALLLHRAADGPALIVAPTSVVPNWVREANRFAPSLRPTVVSGQQQLDEIQERPCIVTTYDLIARHEAAFAARPWATLVLDEAHAIKNASTKRAQAVKALDVRFALALTGTPVENRPGELWSLFQVVAPGLLGSAESFRDELQRGSDALQRVARLVRPFILRRTKAEVAPELPPRVEVRVDVVLSPEERERYERIRRSAVAELKRADAANSSGIAGPSGGGRGQPGIAGPSGGGRGLVKILSVLVRLRQLACHARLVDPQAPAFSSKLERLMALVEELRSEGRRVLVFSQFTELLAHVREAFDTAKVTYAYLDGQTPSEARQAAVDEFQEGRVDAFVLSLKAGGVGLNLTAASEVILLDPWWNPAVEDQAADRAHRIGQDKAVTIYRLVSADTIEDQMLKLHADKRQMVASLLDGTSSSSPLTADELLRLLSEDG